MKRSFVFTFLVTTIAGSLSGTDARGAGTDGAGD
jgi:hypothetical protein